MLLKVGSSKVIFLRHKCGGLVSRRALSSSFFLHLSKFNKTLKSNNPENLITLLTSFSSHSFSPFHLHLCNPHCRRKTCPWIHFWSEHCARLPFPASSEVIFSLFFFFDLGVGCVVKTYSYSLFFSQSAWGYCKRVTLFL